MPRPCPQTLLIMSKPGRIVRPSHVSGIVAKLLEGTAHSAGAVGRIRMMAEGEEEGEWPWDAGAVVFAPSRGLCAPDLLGCAGWQRSSVLAPEGACRGS